MRTSTVLSGEPKLSPCFHLLICLTFLMVGHCTELYYYLYVYAKNIVSYQPGPSECLSCSLSYMCYTHVVLVNIPSMLPYKYWYVKNHHTCDMFTRSFGRRESPTSSLLLYTCINFDHSEFLVGKIPKYRCNILTGDLVGRSPNYIRFKILHTLMYVVVDCLTHLLRKVQTRML